MTKQKNRQRITSIRAGIIPTKERRLQNGGVFAEAVEQDSNGKVLINRYRAVWECPLDAYRDFNLITEQEHRAGIHFRRAYHKAVLSRRAFSERLNNHPTSTGLTMSEKTLKQAYGTLSPHNRETVIDICGHDMQIWNPTALEKLRKGLGHLAVRWNMAAIEVCEHKR